MFFQAFGVGIGFPKYAGPRGRETQPGGRAGARNEERMDLKERERDRDRAGERVERER